MADTAESIRFITCGSVDDGKSTLIGHILFRTGNLYDDQVKTLEAESRKIGNAGEHLDFSLLMDGLLAEREQGITIDVAYRYFSTRRRKFIVADTPGHEQYTRNMATAASDCDAAIVLIDARNGVLPQTRRHALICALMGVPHIAFAVNKIDLCAYSPEVFREIERQCAEIIRDLSQLKLSVRDWVCIPVSALMGDNLTEPSPEMAWYQGQTVLAWLEDLEPYEQQDATLRFPVQYVIKPGLQRDRWQNDALKFWNPEENDNFRLYSGTLFSGKLRVQDRVVLLPSGVRTTIASVIAPTGPVEEAGAGEAVGVTLADKVDASRGDGIFQEDGVVALSDQYVVRVVWMHEQKLYAGRNYICQSAYGQTGMQISQIRNRIDLETYLPCAAEELGKNDIGELEIVLSRPLPLDPYSHNRNCGSFLLIDKATNDTAAAGIVVHSLRRADNVHWQSVTIDRAARAQALGQKPRMIWFTGLSGSGKSTIANALECKLAARGQHTMLLDGDNIRHGLCKDLGFTVADRIENIRRIGEVGKILVDAGLITLTCFISPYREDRALVRNLFPDGEFVEVFVDTPLELCEKRDPKGLYKKARSGQIPNFTGINAPYEAPENPELRLDTSVLSIDDAAGAILEWLARH